MEIVDDGGDERQRPQWRPPGKDWALMLAAVAAGFAVAVVVDRRRPRPPMRPAN